MTGSPSTGAVPRSAPRRPGWRFMAGHPAHWIALGFGSGLSPWAPGTVGTLWAWLAFVALSPWLDDFGRGLAIAAGLVVGPWACLRTAQHLGQSDPGAIVWDEIVAFWIVLWLLWPASLALQLAAFVLFRFFDAAKPGPVGWADRRFEGPPGRPVGGWQAFGILFDDLVAAGCTLIVVAVGVQLWTW